MVILRMISQIVRYGKSENDITDMAIMRILSQVVNRGNHENDITDCQAW